MVPLISPASKLLFIGSLILIAAAPATAPTKGKQYGDVAKTFTVQAAKPWLRHPDLEKANKAIVLGLQYGPSQDGAGRPTFFVLNMGDVEATIQDIARGIIDSARKTQKDQKGIASTENTTLDGEKAVVVNYLLNKDNTLMRVRGIVARHGANLYVAQFVSQSDQWETNEPVGKAVLDSFKWTSK